MPMPAGWALRRPTGSAAATWSPFSCATHLSTWRFGSVSVVGGVVALLDAQTGVRLVHAVKRLRRNI